MGYITKNHATPDKLVISGELAIEGDGKITQDGVEVSLGGDSGLTTITSSDITDATTVGKNLIKAADAAAARSAIGAGAPVNAATKTANGTVKQAAAQADSAATDVAGLLADHNALLAKLRSAGILSTT